MMGRWVVGVAVLFLILILTLPDTDEKSLSRIGSASMLACTKDLRATVESQLQQGVAITARFDNTCPDLITSLEMNDQGAMTIIGNKHKVTMHLKPLLESGKVRWSCEGGPEGYVTKLCKP